MTERIEDKYILYFWSDTYNRYIEYCSYSTLGRVYKQIERYREYWRQKYKEGWNIWKGSKPIDPDKTPYIIKHKQFRLVKELITCEMVEEKLNGY